MAQAIEAGVAKATLYRRVSEGRFRFVCRGVVADAGSELSSEGLLLAHVLSAGAGVMAGPRSTLALHGLTEHPTPPELVAPRSHRYRGSITVARYSDLGPGDRVQRDGIPCLSLERAIIDAAALLGTDDLEALLDLVLRERRTTFDRLRLTVRRLRCRGKSGPQQVSRLLDLRDPAAAPTQSALEDLFRRVTRPLGLTWEGQVTVFASDGVRIVRLDFLCVEFPDLIVEVDGYRWHGGRAAWLRDTRRRTRLTAEGLPPLVFTWDDLARRPDQVLATIQRRVSHLT